MIKFLKKLKVFVSLGMLVLLIFQCIFESVPFILYLVIWIVFFVILNQYLDTNIGDEINGVGVNFSNYINVFRTSVGDIKDPNPVKCDSEDEEDCPRSMTAIWIAFIT